MMSFSSLLIGRRWGGSFWRWLSSWVISVVDIYGVIMSDNCYYLMVVTCACTVSFI